MSVRQKAPPAPAPQLAKPPQAKPRNYRRLAKRGAALALVAIGVYAMVSDSYYVASNNAVVSTYVISLRTPIDGVVDGGMGGVGTPVSAGAALARIENPRVELRHLTDLLAHQERLTNAQAALEQERQDLLQLRARLDQRSVQHQQAVAARLQSRVRSAEGALTAKVAEQQHLRHELERKIALGRTGTAAPAELDAAQAAFDVATREMSGLLGDLAAAQADADAVQHGVLSEPGAMDVAYSTQRADEVELHLLEVAHRAADLSSEQAETARQVAAEQQRIGLLRSADIIAPQEAMVWRADVSAGERLGTGDLVAELVDCQHTFLTVAVPQTRLADISVGSEASFRLSGEAIQRTGRVLSVTGDALVYSDRHLAASPVQERAPTAFVLVAMAPSDNTSSACLVGRTARVLLPSSGGGLLQRTLQRLPLLEGIRNAVMETGPALRGGVSWMQRQWHGHLATPSALTFNDAGNGSPASMTGAPQGGF
jgi:multidrug resistance efflux pump